MPVSPYPKKTFDTFSDGTTPGVWYEILPNLATYPQPWPTVIMGYAGGFKNGTALQANLIAAALTLSAVGIACLSVFSRADKKLIPGQATPAFWPTQTDDYKRAVLAARRDSRFDPLRIGGVAASSGAANLFGCASEAGPTDCPNCVPWTSADRLKAFVGMSGPYQYNDRTPYIYLKPFVQDVNIYCQSSDLGRQTTCSPTNLMDSDTCTSYFVAGELENQPPSQYNAIIAKCDELAVTNVGYFIPGGTLHGFDNWNSAVNNGVIDWLVAALDA